MDWILSGLIVALTAGLVLRFFLGEGGGLEKARYAFRFFTVQSNLLCALGALALCLFPGAAWAWGLKYVGTAAVTVTMLTVALFLGPTLGIWRELYSGTDLFMHLVTPLLALISFCGLERRGMGVPMALLGLLPVLLYALLYGWKVLVAKTWEDFYGFNRDGRWVRSVVFMVLGTLLICLGLMALQTL